MPNNIQFRTNYFKIDTNLQIIILYVYFCTLSIFHTYLKLLKNCCPKAVDMKKAYEKLSTTPLGVKCSEEILTGSYPEVKSMVKVESFDDHIGFDSLNNGSFDISF